eukprot:363226-Chlamydomonas_euryale.AAC.7
MQPEAEQVVKASIMLHGYARLKNSVARAPRGEATNICGRVPQPSLGDIPPPVCLPTVAVDTPSRIHMDTAVSHWIRISLDLTGHGGLHVPYPSTLVLKCSDVHGALEAAGASEIGWRSASRAIVHMADSPGHGTRLHDETAHDDVRQPWYDQLPNYDEHGNLLFKLMKKLFVLRQGLGFRMCFSTQMNHCVVPYYYVYYTRTSRSQPPYPASFSACNRTPAVDCILHPQVQKYCFIHIPIKDPIRFPGEERIFTRTMFKKLQEACGNHGMMAEVEWNNPQEMMLQMGKFLRENIMEWRGGSRLVERIDDPSSGMSDSPDSDSNEASSYATDIVPPENCVVGSGRDIAVNTTCVLRMSGTAWGNMCTEDERYSMGEWTGALPYKQVGNVNLWYRIFYHGSHQPAMDAVAGMCSEQPQWLHQLTAD